MDFRIILFAFGVPAFGIIRELAEGKFFASGAHLAVLTLVTLYFVGLAFDKRPGLLKWVTQCLILAFFVLAAASAWAAEKRMGVMVMTVLGATFFPLELLMCKLQARKPWGFKVFEVMGTYFVLIYIFWYIGMI